MNVKKLGNKVEREFCIEMYKRGWWCTILADKINGQPFDCILVKDKKPLFVDVKNVENGDYFLTSRIEDNQFNAFRMLCERGNDGCCFFACKFDGEFYMLEFTPIIKDVKKIHKDSMVKLEDFLRYYVC